MSEEEVKERKTEPILKFAPLWCLAKRPTLILKEPLVVALGIVPKEGAKPEEEVKKKP